MATSTISLCEPEPEQAPKKALALPVLHIINGEHYSGAERVQDLLALRLPEFGYQVVGPICTAAEAAARAKDGPLEAAVLDINLGDGAVYPIADILAARGVPFVFVTGYDADSIDARFRKIPVLQKPIEREMLKKASILSAS